MSKKKSDSWPPAVRYTLKVLGALGKCLMTIFLIGVITVTMVGCVLVVYVITQFKADDSVPELENLSATAGTVISVKNADGEWEEYQQLQGAHSIWKDIDVIPLHVQRAYIAIEDERFETHYGVDWKRTVAAVINLAGNVLLGADNNEFGGSTITQQLIKNTTGDKDHDINRKITEILRAVEMEKHYTKPEILEAYLNNVPLTGDYVGVGIGAQVYFAKDIQDVTIAEAAVLASITANPSRYHPYNHPENIRARQRTVLSKMYELDFITADEYKQAMGEELHFRSGLTPTGTMDYYTDLLVEDIIADLMDTYGYTYNYAQNMVFYGGLRIQSAEIPSQQQAVEAVYANEDNFPKHLEKDKEDPQGAIFIMDYDGRVVATVGGRGKKTAARVLNRSTQSTRQPGSSMKPLTAYTPAVYYNTIHYSSIVRNASIKVDGRLWPPNYGGKAGDFGTVLVNYALEKSLNTVAVRLVDELTPQKCFDFGADRFHLTSLVKSRVINGQVYGDINLAPMALGGLTDGVIARDMAAAYAVFGNGGLYNRPYTYYEVSRGGEDTGTEKEILLSKGPSNLRSIDEDTAYVMNRMMQQVVRSGTAAAGIGANWKNWEVYGKTGTTDNNVDVYFCGGTPYYVGASWFGYDDNTHLTTQTAYAMRLWNLSMKALHNGLEVKSFGRKGTTKELKYCTQTGLIASAGCPKTATGVYKQENIPATCTQHSGEAAAAAG